MIDVNNIEFEKSIECNGRINTLLSLIDEWNDNLIGLVNRISFANCIKPHKRNISTVAVFFFRLYGGGTERVTASHVNLLVEMGYRVILITEEYCPEKEFKISPKVIREFIPYEKPLSKDTYEKRGRKLEEICAKYDVDLFLYESFGVKASFWDTLLIKMLGIPVIMQFHGILSMQMIYNRRKLRNRLATYLLADRVIVLSHVEELCWASLGVKAEYAPNPIEGSIYDLDYHKGKYVLWAGRMDDSQKRPIDALKIIALVKKKIPDVKLVMVGGGDESTDKIKIKAEDLGVADNVEIMGFVPNMEKYYQNASIQLVTSSFEAFSMVIYESRIAGLPLVCYDMPYLEMLKNRDSFLPIEQGNIEGAAEAIIRLLNDDRMHFEYSNKAKSVAKDFLSYSVSDALKKIFESVFEPYENGCANRTFGIGLETVLFHYDLGAEKYHERVNKLKRRNMELIEKNERLAEKNRRLTEKNEKANSKLKAVKESKSYRIGKLITLPYRKLRKK